MIFNLNPIEIFGPSLAFAFVIGVFSVWQEIRRRGLSEEKVFDILFLATIFTIISARLGFVYNHNSLFLQDMSRIFFVFKYPGLSFPVASLSIIIFTAIFSWATRQKPLLILDIFSCALAPVMAIGFLGCFFNQCASPNIYLPLVFFIVWTVIGLIFFFLTSIFRKKPKLSQTASRYGLFTLAYLIFLSLCLLIQQVQLSAKVSWFYLTLAGSTLTIFIFRYHDFLKQIYDSIPKKRSHPNREISGEPA